MHGTVSLAPGGDAAETVKGTVLDVEGSQLFTLYLDGTSTLSVSDPRAAMAYFASIAREAERLMDAADNAVLAQSLEAAS